MDKPKTYRSFLWPILLIGVGVIWLLSSLGIIPSANLAALVSLWPLILIVIGLDLLFAPFVGSKCDHWSGRCRSGYFCTAGCSRAEPADGQHNHANTLDR